MFVQVGFALIKLDRSPKYFDTYASVIGAVAEYKCRMVDGCALAIGKLGWLNVIAQHVRKRQSKAGRRGDD